MVFQWAMLTITTNSPTLPLIGVDTTILRAEVGGVGAGLLLTKTTSIWSAMAIPKRDVTRPTEGTNPANTEFCLVHNKSVPIGSLNTIKFVAEKIIVMVLNMNTYENPQLHTIGPPQVNGSCNQQRKTMWCFPLQQLKSPCVPKNGPVLLAHGKMVQVVLNVPLVHIVEQKIQN